MFYWIAATLAAFFVKGLCGFANTLVFQSILSFGQANSLITPVELVVGYPTNAILAFRHRDKIDYKMALPLASILVLSGIPGALLLKRLDSSLIKVIFGIIIILIGLEMFYRESHPKEIKRSKVGFLITGILAGLLCGLFGIGVILGAYISRLTGDTKALKANMGFIFFLENTCRIINYSICGIITGEVLRQVVILLPFMLLGLFLGMKSSNILDERIVKKIVIVAIVFSGIALIAMNL